MIKFLAEDKGTKRIILGLGLTAANLKHLKQDEPIHFNAEQMGIPSIQVQEVVIFYGETEESIKSDFESKGYLTEARIKVDKGDRH